MTDLSKGQRLCDRFLLLEPLGRGGQAEVWRALDERRSEQVAVKVVRTSTSTEESAWQRLIHQHEIFVAAADPGVLRVEAPLADSDCLVLPMSLAASDARAWRGKPLVALLPLLREIAATLERLHERGIAHGDLKPANILFDFSGRALLADFAAAGEASPFSASPQQRAGRAVGITDDIYAFGALIFELLTGYPPQYPQRPRGAVPAPAQITVAESLPPRFERLVLSMLSPHESERPQSMHAIGLILTGLDTPSLAAETERPPRPWLPVAIGAGVLAVLWGVFVILPTMAPEATPDRFRQATADAVATTDLAAIEARRTLRNEYEKARAEFELQLESLEVQGAGVWGGETFAAAKQLADQAEQAADGIDHVLALERIETATRRLERVATQRVGALSERLRIGRTAIEAGQLDVARQAFEMARQIDPGNGEAERGLVRVLALGPVLGDLAAAETARLAKDFLRAWTLYESVLRADPQNQTAIAGLRDVRAATGSDRYAREIGAALAELRAGRLEAARAALGRAAAQRPGAAEIAGVERQLQAAMQRIELQGSAVEITALEQDERWSEALQAYEALLKRDAGLSFAREGRARVAPRAELSARLQALLDRPERLSAPEVRREAQRLLGQAVTHADAPALREQERQLRTALQRYEKTILAVIRSDGLTEIRVQRVGAFGVFERKEIALKPGRYVFIGSRTGYREVRREVVIDPDGDAPIIEIRCTERLT